MHPRHDERGQGVVTFRFPHLPSAQVGGNARGVWAKGYAETKRLRRDAMLRAKSDLRGVHYDRCRATVTFEMPSPGIRRDWDNFVKRTKPIFDGLVDAKILDDDDSQHLTIVAGDPLFVKGPGAVVILLEAI